ncbi:Regulatory protein leu3 [Paecilomyces lecythidis]
MAVAARHFDTDTTLLPRLTVVLSELLHRTVLSQSVSIAQVQALIILVCWPLPNYRLRTDNSLLYANIALTGAMQLGLHMPGYEHEYTASHDRMPPSPEKALERSRTWVAAVILSQSLSTDLGLAPIAPMMIDGLTSRPSLEIPQTLKQYLVIQEYSYRATQTLLQASQSPSDPLAFYSALASLERSFDTLQEDLGTELSFVNTIRLAAARLHLQSMYFLPHTSRQRQQRRDSLLRAYTTAASLITTAISHKDSLEDLLYAPAEVLRMIFAAALVVFRVSNSSYADMLGPRSGTSSGRALSSMACFAIHRCSVQRGENKDLAARMVDMLGIIWRYAEADARLLRQEPVVQVSSRMGAGVVFDCLDIWRRYKTGREPQCPPTPQQSCTTSQESRVDHVLGSSAALEGASLEGALPEGLDMVAASTFDEDLAWNFSASLDPSPENWGVYGLV